MFIYNRVLFKTNILYYIVCNCLLNTNIYHSWHTLLIFQVEYIYFIKILLHKTHVSSLSATRNKYVCIYVCVWMTPPFLVRLGPLYSPYFI